MSKGVLINALDTYIGTALYEELLGRNPEELDFELYGTYYNREISDRPKHVKKMMKRKEKPGLFRKYMLDHMDYFIYDLHSGKFEDLEWAVKALTKAPLESEKTLIVISSVLSWGENPHYMVEDKPEEENLDDNFGEDNLNKLNENSNILAESMDKENLNGEDVNAENHNKEENSNTIEDIDEEDFNNLSNHDKNEKIEENKNDQSLTEQLDYNGDNPNQNKVKKKTKKKTKIIKEIKYKRIGYSEEEYNKRIPIESYQKIKDYEDYLMNLQVDNLNVYIICAGIPYGNCETVFNYFFKTAWLQHPESLPYFSSGENLIPTIHVKDLANIVKKIINGNKPEGKFIFAVDQTVDKSMKSIISVISRGIGSGKTESIDKYEDWVRSLNFTQQDFFIDPKINEKNKLTLVITNNELRWEGYLGVDIMLKPSKYLDEDFEWHCKEGISTLNIPKLLNEFCLNRKLSPIKIILNCEDRNLRCVYAKHLSKFYNIPIINYEKTFEFLSLKKEKLTEEEKFMKSKYLLLKERMEFIEANPDFKNEENLLFYDYNEITIEAVKYLLRENASKNRGYVLEGMPINYEEVERLYYKKVEVIPEEGEQEPNDDEDDEENIDKFDIPADSMALSMADNNDNNNESINNIDGNNLEMINENSENVENSLEKSEKSVNRESISYDNSKNKLKIEGTINTGGENKIEKVKKKKIRPKIYKTVFDKELLPHSVITMCQKNKENLNLINNPFWQVENFYQKNKIEILNLVLDREQEEILEAMRIYIERNGRPFNYFTETEQTINEKRMNYLKEKAEKNEIEINEQKKREQELELEKENQYWAKMLTRIEEIKLEKEDLESHSDAIPVRKFLLLNVMPILTKGMLEVCKINPIDPIDYLADFLFKNSNDYD